LGGLWPGVIARRAGNRFQIAFGHHRIEAARQAKLKEVSLIVHELSDEQMLQYMGRENMEDYAAEFPVMLESWEAATEFLRRAAQKAQDLDVAVLLGWTRSADGHGVRMTDTALACANASRLIEGGYMARKDLRGLPVRAVRMNCALCEDTGWVWVVSQFRCRRGDAADRDGTVGGALPPLGPRGISLLRPTHSFGHQFARYSKGNGVSSQDQNNAPIPRKISHRCENMAKRHRRKHPRRARGVCNRRSDYARAHLKPRRRPTRFLWHAITPCFSLSIPRELGQRGVEG
jgi:hypothetical protein